MDSGQLLPIRMSRNWLLLHLVVYFIPSLVKTVHVPISWCTVNSNNQWRSVPAICDVVIRIHSCRQCPLSCNNLIGCLNLAIATTPKVPDLGIVSSTVQLFHMGSVCGYTKQLVSLSYCKTSKRLIQIIFKSSGPCLYFLMGKHLENWS